MFFQSHVFCCTNRRESGSKRGSCAEKGAEELRDYIKSRVKELGAELERFLADHTRRHLLDWAGYG